MENDIDNIKIGEKSITVNLSCHLIEDGDYYIVRSPSLRMSARSNVSIEDATIRFKEILKDYFVSYFKVGKLKCELERKGWAIFN